MPAGRSKRWQLNLFSFFVTGISRFLMLRDRLRGVPRRLKRPAGGDEFFFASGGRRLAGVLVAAGDWSPVVLICHGIGETVEHWSAVQALLEERRVGSMVFNYSGYGKSEGTIRAEHCDEDFVSAYAELRRRVGAERRVFVLGFSMGSGIAGSGVGGLRPAPEGLFLCQAFTTFREATRAVGVPGLLVRFAPDIWDTVAAMRSVQMPVCVMPQRWGRVVSGRDGAEDCCGCGRARRAGGGARAGPQRAVSAADGSVLVRGGETVDAMSNGLFRLGGVEAAVVVVQEVVLGGFEVQERAVAEAGGEGGFGRGVRPG